MKRILMSILAVLMVFSLAVAVSAANEYGYEEVGDWYVGKGFPLDGTDGEVSKPVASEGEDGAVNVATGGWYTNGESWGGVASKDLYMLDGLKVEVQFSKVSEVGDRWVNIGFFENPDIFKVSNIPSNRGYGNLIRPLDDQNLALVWNHIEAVSSWNNAGPQIFTPFTNDLKLVLEAKKTDAGNWQFFLNGTASPEYIQYDNIFRGDRAYVVVAASGQHAIDSDSYSYTVKVTGEKAPALTEEEIAEWDAAIEEKRAAAQAEAEKKAAEAAAQAEAEKKAQEEAEAAEAAKEALEGNEEVTEETPDNSDNSDAVVVDEGNSALPIILIIIAVVVIVVVAIAVLANKKKK